MATIDEILAEAEQVRTNNTPDSNTPALVGGAIKDLANFVNGKADEIASEKERAKAAEEENANAIEKETKRAKEAESRNTDAIEEEVKRAKAAEQENADEIERLDKYTDELHEVDEEFKLDLEQVSQDLSAEIGRAKAAENSNLALIQDADLKEEQQWTEAQKETARKNIETLSETEIDDKLSAKQDAPETPGRSGQVLGLDSNRKPKWITQSGGGGTGSSSAEDIEYDSTLEEHTEGSVGEKIASIDLNLSEIESEIGDVETLINEL